MENIEESMPGCALKCLRNVEDTSQSVHKVKYGVNTIGRGLNNDIILKNLNVSRTHCHLRVEKKESKDIAYIKDLGTSNGTIVGNINLIQFEEHQLNDLDMIVLASGDEGVVLQYIDKVDRTINFSNLCNNNKRKVLCEENLDDDSTAVKIPKLVINETESNLLKKPLSNANTNPSNLLNNLPNVANNLQQAELKNQLELVNAFFKTYQDFDDQKLPVEDPKIIPNSTEPSCSKYSDNISSSVKIKIEPDTIINNVFSQGTYRDEEDSVVYCISDEENDINDNGLESSNNKIEKQEQMNTSSTKHSCPSTSKIENNLNFPELSFQCQRNGNTRDDIDDVIYIPPNMYSDNINTLISSSDSESDYISKCPKIIEPFPMKVNKRGQTKLLVENKYIIKTRAKSEKIIHCKKKAEEEIVDQNKQIIQERQMRLKKLATNNSINEIVSTNDNFIDKPSTIGKLKKKSRISRLEQINNDNCIPSTSKSHLPILEVDKKVGFNCKEIITINNQIEQFSFSNYKNIDSSTTKMIKPINFAFFDTLSRICKWNAVWLYEEKFADASPPLVKNIYKMKEQFDTPSEYSSTMNSVLFYEIWSKISESYHMVLSRNPNLEQSIFEKSSKKNLPLPTFDIQSVNKEFSTSVPALKSINQPLWCLKCIGTTKNIETLTGSRNSLKGCLCIVIVQSNCFGTDIVGNKKPTKSRNIFFGYVNMTKKIGYHSNSQFYMELIVTKKTENIPNGTHIHLMDIFYLLSELRLFQAINNVTTSSLCKALITPQFHNYSIDSSKANLKNYNINSLLLNNSQKEAVKMAVTICNAVEPNVGLIIGPPGTGKTNVICNIILSLMSKQLAKTKTKPKLLICAPSNEAADAIVRRIIEIKKDLKHESQFNVVRVGSGQKYDPNSPIVDVMLDTVIKQKMGNPLNEANRQCQSNNLFIYTNKKDLENEILINTEVIVTTLNSCFSKTMEETFKPTNIKSLNNCHFTACIVDEAGQSIEPLIFVPILLGIDKLILVGDDKQLQPLVKSKVAKDNGLGISLFKRLKTWFEQKRSTRKSFPVTMLNTQYRMHKEICLFPSKYFYKGEIKTAPSVKMRKQLSFHPYMILEHESLQDNTGEVNIGEANMIVTLVDILLNSECRSLTVAVLTPYHKQREQINILLKKKKISLNVNTIDSFQGGECDVLLISTVRTNGVGFMDDICRLNVALTRAKQSLIICGNFMSLRIKIKWLASGGPRSKSVQRKVAGNSTIRGKQEFNHRVGTELVPELQPHVLNWFPFEKVTKKSFKMDHFYELLSEKTKFCHQIECLITSIDRINNDPVVKERLEKLKHSIESCVENCGRVYIYGSRMYGIAKDDSDVDLYFDTGDCFSGKIADDYTRQLQLIDLFVKAANKEFIGLEIITETRIPIVRFTHDSTNFNCDLQFRSGLAVLNSELIKLYLSMDERVRWVVIAVKHWAVSFQLLCDDFSTYSLIWLVLYVMMQYKIVPPIIDLWRMHQKHAPIYTEGWDTRICFNYDQLKPKKSSKSSISKLELLRYVFEFYSESNSIILQKYVLCTVLGEILPKKTFYSTFITKVNAIDNYQCQTEKFEKCETLINTNFGSFNRIELQNPLKLCNNVIPWLSDTNMNVFIDLCTKSANSM